MRTGWAHEFGEFAGITDFNGVRAVEAFMHKLLGPGMRSDKRRG